MKGFLAPLLLALVMLAPQAARAEGTLWVREFGNSGGASGQGIALSGSDAYVAGWTNGTFPGQTSAGSTDAFLRKFGQDGSIGWTRQFGSPATDITTDVAFTPHNAVVVGYTRGALGPEGYLGGFYDAFVRAYDNHGNVLWTHQLGTSGDDYARAVAAEPSGVFVVGGTNGAFPGGGPGYAYVSKYSLAGDLLWTRQFGSADAFPLAFGVAYDGTTVYVAGYVDGAFPGHTSAGRTDAFVRAFDRQGNTIWTRQFGSTATDIATDVEAGSTGVFATGYTTGTLPGATSRGQWDAWVRGYDPAGHKLWTRQFGTYKVDIATGVAVDETGIYSAGYTWGSLAGEPRLGDIESDGFVRKYGPTGKRLYTVQFGTHRWDRAEAIEVASHVAFIAGTTRGTFPGEIHHDSFDAFAAAIG